MNTAEYISSGILEQYCLGLISDTERKEVEEYAKLYPGIGEEISSISLALDDYALNNSIKPGTAEKIKLLLSVYEQESGKTKDFPPLINKDTVADDFRKWIEGHPIPDPEHYDNLSFYDLPSTNAVTNFMVWAKEGHDEEEHSEFNEYVVILSGHCDMYFNGESRHYEAGQIIVIPPLVPHHAVITSDTPMIAIVQRQLIAA